MSDPNTERGRRGEVAGELGRRLTELARWMVLEGIIDPKKGTDFELWQFDISSSTLNSDMTTWDGPRKFVAGFGIPDPVEAGFNEIAANTILESKEE